MNSSQVFSRVWAAFDAGEPVIACAWCGRVRLDGDWFRPPPAVVEAIDARLAFSHSICSGCTEAYLPPPTPAPTGLERATTERNLMTDATEFTIGSDVSCSDGVCGELKRVVVDPVARALTHLVVEPKHGSGEGRLVPVDLVESAGQEIRLRCTSAEFDALEHAEETRFLPGAGGQWAYQQQQMLSWPYYRLGMGMGGMGGMGMGTDSMGMGNMNVGPQAVTRDRVPVGDVQVRRGEHVHATDGDIGRVQGLVVDPADHHVTHVLLDEGHLWGKKEVAIPIGAVTDVDDGVRLSLTKDEVADLPPVELDGAD